MVKIIAFLASKNFVFRSWMYNLLVRTVQVKRLKKIRNKIWNGAVLANVDKPVSTALHGYKAMVNCGFIYPLIARTYRTFNNPYLQLVYLKFKQKNKPLIVADIGAAVGDGVFFLLSNLPGAFEKIICIDGDKEFFNYLLQNTKYFSFVTAKQTVLADKSGEIKSLKRIHAGTASAQGDQLVQTTTLDKLFEENNFPAPDIIKIDTDGFDGKVLSGAQNILLKHKPAVIFEWHPIHIKDTGNDFYTAFTCLDATGYSQFVFFNKYGVFTHFMIGFHKEEIEKLVQLCLNENYEYDWHYDVVALQPNDVDITELAECAFAKNKKSAY